MKTLLERTLPIQQAFLRVVDGETHHIQRNVAPKDVLIIGYGCITESEKNVFRRLAERNAKNLNFLRHRLIFTSEENLMQVMKNEVCL